MFLMSPVLSSSTTIKSKLSSLRMFMLKCRTVLKGNYYAKVSNIEVNISKSYPCEQKAQASECSSFQHCFLLYSTHSSYAQAKIFQAKNLSNYSLGK